MKMKHSINYLEMNIIKDFKLKCLIMQNMSEIFKDKKKFGNKMKMKKLNM